MSARMDDVKLDALVAILRLMWERDTQRDIADREQGRADALAKDAARYRLLRTFKRRSVYAIKADQYRGDTMLFDDELDAAIDAEADR